MTLTSQAGGANTTLRSDGLWEPARHDLHVVALGGGTGLPTVLRGLRTSLALHRHAPTVPIRDVLINTAPLAPELVARYASLGATPVPADVEGLKALGQTIVEGDLLARGDGVRHDPDKLGHALLARVTQAGGRP
jgi:2-phospho-L-lactate transferase/gluconeogenesis factor (CofD/UPF0052 family)